MKGIVMLMLANRRTAVCEHHPMLTHMHPPFPSISTLLPLPLPPHFTPRVYGYTAVNLSV